MDNPSHQKIMHVHLLGLGLQLQNSLNFLFDSVYPGEVVFVEHDADFSIVDIDNYNGKQLLREHHAENPGQVLVLLSLKEMQAQPDTNIVYLRKPFSKEQMIAAIEQARNKAAAQKVVDTPPEISDQNLPDASLNNQRMNIDKSVSDQMHSAKIAAASVVPTASDLGANEGISATDTPPPAADYRPYVKNIQSSTLALSKENMFRIMDDAARMDAQSSLVKLEYDPDRFLSGALLRAYRRAAKNKCQLLLKVRDCPILLDPRKKLAWLDMDNIHNKSLASIPLEERWLEHKLLVRGEKVEKLKGNPISMEALIWETALYGARGRVPKGTILDSPVRLKHWPNFTRILLFPEAMRIAALLSEHTYSLTKTAQLLKIDERCIYSFYSAAYALGLVSIVYTKTTETEELTEKPLPQTRKRALFNGILERLKTSIFSEKS